LVSADSAAEADDAVQVLSFKSGPRLLISHVDDRVASTEQEAAKLTGEASIAPLLVSS